jgi:hypothetical protein
MTDPDARGWRNSLRRHDVLVFMLAALILTWVVWVPRAMGAQVGVIGQLWTWIPALVAVGCATLLYAGWPRRSGPPIAAVAGQLVVVSGCPAGAAGVRDDRCRDSSVDRRAVECSAPARDHLVDPCTRVDVPDSGAHRRTRRTAGLAWLPAATGRRRRFWRVRTAWRVRRIRTAW